MLGLPKGCVFLSSWDKEWENYYLIEKEKIMKLIGENITAIHHIGSTSVRGLFAKPIIDIAIEIHKFDDGFLCIDNLKTLGYKHRIIPELPERHYFSKGEPRTHQIHMFPKGSIYLQKQLAFRDCLNKNSYIKEEYQKIKEEFATEYNKDKFAYADAKTDFINKVLARFEI